MSARRRVPTFIPRLTVLEVRTLPKTASGTVFEDVKRVGSFVNKQRLQHDLRKRGHGHATGSQCSTAAIDLPTGSTACTGCGGRRQSERSRGSTLNLLAIAR
jgi:hypothetical protein